jgi:hypothetical protein
MSDTKKYWRTVVKVTVLSEHQPVGDADLETIAREIVTGDWSGETKVLEQIEITADEMAKELIAQGSDPGFFGLEDNGIDGDEEEED